MDSEGSLSEHQESMGPSASAPKYKHKGWTVNVIDLDGVVHEKTIAVKDVWSLRGQKVVVRFNRLEQAVGQSAGLLAGWIGQIVCDPNLFPLNIIDWRKEADNKKETAWNMTRGFFHFEDEGAAKKWVLGHIGKSHRDKRSRLWTDHKKETLEATYANRPSGLPAAQWKDFVDHRFKDDQKKRSKKNQNSSKLHTLPHTLGKKSIARLTEELRNQTGEEPNRVDMFIRTRKHGDGRFVNADAEKIADQLSRDLSQFEEGSTGLTAHIDELMTQCLGKEHSGRVRCFGFGPTPKKICIRPTTTNDSQIQELEARLKASNEQVNLLKTHVSELEKIINDYVAFSNKSSVDSDETQPPDDDPDDLC